MAHLNRVILSLVMYIFPVNVLYKQMRDELRNE